MTLPELNLNGFSRLIVYYSGFSVSGRGAVVFSPTRTTAIFQGAGYILPGCFGVHSATFSAHFEISEWPFSGAEECGPEAALLRCLFRLIHGILIRLGY